jgi:hypothetical protein
VGRLYLVADGGEIARRRPRLPVGRLVEAWPDLYSRGECWVGEDAKALLDGAGTPLAAKLEVEPAAVPIYYGPRVRDLDSLPAEESLLTRVLSAHGVAVVWITLDRLGERNQYEPQSPTDPVFHLRRPGGSVTHLWRLVRSRREASTYMAENFGDDAEARRWAEAVPAATWEDLVERHARHG